VKTIADARAQFSRWLVLIGLAHSLTALVVLLTIYWTNVPFDSFLERTGIGALLVNCALIGFLGSLLYFGRKCYLYLITDKFDRSIRPNRIREGDGDGPQDLVSSRVAGYCLYLATRQLAGLVIGPLIALVIVGGLVTLGAPSSSREPALSRAGTMIVYAVSFLGGYSSSDLFDYVAKMGAKLIRRMRIPS
jgi:hypothetical protein